MSETPSPDFIGRRLDDLQNNITGLSRRMITLQATLNDRMGTVEVRMAGLEGCVDQLVERISALETRVNCLILLVERSSNQTEDSRAGPSGAGASKARFLFGYGNTIIRPYGAAFEPAAVRLRRYRAGLDQQTRLMHGHSNLG
jgi:hypothetical protein